MDVVEIRYRLTRRDLVLATAVVFRLSQAAFAFAALGVLVTVPMVQGGDPTWWLPLLFGAAGATGFGPALLGAGPWSRLPGIDSDEIGFTADAAGLRTTMPISAKSASWSRVRSVRETRDCFLLDLGPAAVTFVPKRVMASSEMETLRRLATASGALDIGSSWLMPVLGTLLGVAVTGVVVALFAAGVLVWR